MSFTEGFINCKENTDNLNEKYSRLEACMRVHIFEAARECFNGSDFADIIYDTNGALDKYNEAIKTLVKENAYPETLIRMYFCEGAAKTIKMPQNEKELCNILSGSNAQIPKNPLVCCIRGAMSDKAFDGFSEILGTPRVRYADSFTEVCESVYHSQCDLAIIPKISSNEGILAGFSHLTEKYELFSVCALELENENDFEIVTYMLLAKNPMFSECKGTLNISFKMTQGNSEICSVAVLAEYFKANISQLHSHIMSDGRVKTQYVFELTENNLREIITALCLNFPGTEIDGIYYKMK